MKTVPILPFKSDPLGAIAGSDRNLVNFELAKELEVTFLSEMLKAAGFDKRSSGFDGGIGEEQFTSFLREAQAEAMVDAGGIGLAEALFRAFNQLEGKNAVH